MLSSHAAGTPSTGCTADGTRCGGTPVVIDGPNPATVDHRKLATRNTKKVTNRMRRLGPRWCSCSVACGSLVSTNTIATNTMLASTPESAECHPPATTYRKPAVVLHVCDGSSASCTTDIIPERR